MTRQCDASCSPARGAPSAWARTSSSTSRSSRAPAPDELFRTVEEHYNPIVTTLVGMAKPVVAAVNGVAAGAGASLAFACDLRILADTAGYNLAFAGVALSCDTGSSFTLQRLVGPARAIELLYQPRTIKADEALSLGLATRVVPAAEPVVEVAGAGDVPRRGPDRRVRRDPSLGRVRRRPHVRGSRRLRGPDDDPDRRHRRPPRRRPRLRRTRRSPSSRADDSSSVVEEGALSACA